MEPIAAPRFERSRVMRLDAEPAAVFPLLCPVREYDWIEGWSCELVHCPRGRASRDCVFATDFPGMGPETWICTRHDPPHQVEYVRFAHEGAVTRLTLTLAHGEEPGTTTLLWELAASATSPGGGRVLAALADVGYPRLEVLYRQLAAHLAARP